MKSYTTIRDKCDLTNQSNILSRVNTKYNLIRFMEININSYFPREHKNLDRVRSYMESYSALRYYKIINDNYNVYNFIKNNQKIRNSIRAIVKTYIYPVNKYIKRYARLVECLGIKIKDL